MARQTSRALGRPLQIIGAMLLIASAYLLSLTETSSAAVAATVTPNSGLHDQDQVRVQATGLPANTVIAVVECTRTATSSADCEGSTADVSTSSNGTGAYDNPTYTVLVLPDPIFPVTSITCDDTHPCSLYVGTDFNDFTAPHTLVPITFAAGTGTTTTTTSTTSTTTSTTTPATTTTSLSGATTTTTSSAGSTTSTSSTGAASSNSAASTTTTTLGPLGTGFSATVVHAPSDPSDPGVAVAGGRVGAASAERAADRAADGTDPSDSVHIQSAEATDPTIGPVAFTGARLAPWLAVLGLLALFGGSVARRLVLREQRGP